MYSAMYPFSLCYGIDTSIGTGQGRTGAGGGTWNRQTPPREVLLQILFRTLILSNNVFKRNIH